MHQAILLHWMTLSQLLKLYFCLQIQRLCYNQWIIQGVLFETDKKYSWRRNFENFILENILD